MLCRLWRNGNVINSKFSSGIALSRAQHQIVLHQEHCMASLGITFTPFTVDGVVVLLLFKLFGLGLLPTGVLSLLAVYRSFGMVLLKYVSLAPTFAYSQLDAPFCLCSYQSHNPS
jgi:hypothetical protein